MAHTIIAWDLGATKCAAGLLQYDAASNNIQCSKTFTVKLTETNSLTDLIGHIETGLKCNFNNADAICIGAAGHFDGRNLTHFNPYPYDMPFAAIAKAHRWPPFSVIHDYASIVCSTFTAHVEQKGNPYGRRVAFGIGTGLGLKDGVLLQNGDFWLGHNEMGHIGISMPPHAKPDHLERHRHIIKFLRDKNALPQVTFEKILSGQGLARLHQFFYPAAGLATPEEAGSALCAGKTPELADAFAWYAGLFAGTVQLSFMPDGGVYITGGVALIHAHLFELQAFTDGIQASPAYLSQRANYPITILSKPDTALYGCAYYAARKLIKL